MAKQEYLGVRFDWDKAAEYLSILDEEKRKEYDNVRKILEPEVEMPGKEVREPWKLDGELAQRTKKYLGDQSPSGPFQPVRFNEPDLGSNQKIIRQLKKYGWEPTEWTEKGNPKLTEDSLENLNRPETQSIAKWSKLDHKHSQLLGLVENVREDGRIPARVISLSTNTGRVSHRVVANIPKPNKDEDGNLLWYPEGKKVFGTELRSLFTVTEGRRMVGVDASGLEARILAHYVNDPEFTREILEGDIHTKMLNACYPLVDSRSTMKNIFYGYLYGAGTHRLGREAGYTSNDASSYGRSIRKGIEKALPGIADLSDKVSKASRRGYIVGIDGRKVWMRRNSSGEVLSFKALNTLIQSAGIIVIKVATCYQEKWVREEGLDAFSIIQMHDEAEWDAREDHAEDVKEFLEKSIPKAGTFFNIRCPLEGEAMIGDNWAEVH